MLDGTVPIVQHVLGCVLEQRGGLREAASERPRSALATLRSGVIADASSGVKSYRHLRSGVLSGGWYGHHAGSGHHNQRRPRVKQEDESDNRDDNRLSDQPFSLRIAASDDASVSPFAAATPSA